MPGPTRTALEAASATAAEATTRGAAAAEAGATGAPRGRGHYGAGLRGHQVEVVDEEDRVEIGAVGTLVPTGWLGVDALKGLAPVFFNAESHGEGQELLEHFGRFDGAVETVGFDVAQEIFKAERAFQGAGALLGVRGHEQAERADDDAAENAADDKRKRGHAKA